MAKTKLLLLKRTGLLVKENAELAAKVKDHDVVKENKLG